MKSKKEITEKTIQYLKRYLKEAKSDLLSRKTCNCSRSKLVKLGQSNSFYLCNYRLLCNQDDFFACNDKYCSECELFICRNTVESVKSDFYKIIKNPALCGEKYPKLSGLLWVLGGDLTGKEIKEEKPSFKEKVRRWIKLIFA